MLIENTKVYLRDLLSTLDSSVGIKLLSTIEEENGIARGTIGQSFEIVISSLPKNERILNDIFSNTDLNITVRNYASMILAMNLGHDAFDTLSGSGLDFANSLVELINHTGGVYPYS